MLNCACRSTNAAASEDASRASPWTWLNSADSRAESRRIDLEEGVSIPLSARSGVFADPAEPA